MNINRNNYEEFFLLYADNELSAEDRLLVDAFVLDNPDLKAELLMFLDAVLIPEAEIHFPGKELLFKQENAFISFDNAESIFMLYHDKELNSEEKIKTEEFLNKYPESQKLFQDIKVSRFHEDTIVYPWKNELYKKVESRVIPLGYWRVAAAAILILFVIYGGVKYYSKQRTTDTADRIEPTKGANNILPVIEQIQKPKPTITEKNIAVTKSEALTSADKDANIRKDKAGKNQPVATSTNDVKIRVPLNATNDNIIPKKEEFAIIEKQKPTNELPEPLQKMPDNYSTETALVKPEVITQESSLVSQASFREEEINKDNYVFYNISEERFKKSKVGIFLRKVKRAVGRNAIVGGNKGRIANVDPQTK